jgi:serine/threonine protein kinase
VLGMFLAAGEGLVAAHRARVVHRDFKLDNVMVDHHGRARVVDFGVAAIVASETKRTGPRSLVGTLPYMAPEQLRGEECDARADQFAYCIALWEALHGSRPFVGKTAHELGAAIAARQVCEPVRKTPEWVRNALLRGMACEPDARWSSLEDLLRVLHTAPDRSSCAGHAGRRRPVARMPQPSERRPMLARCAAHDRRMGRDAQAASARRVRRHRTT